MTPKYQDRETLGNQDVWNVGVDAEGALKNPLPSFTFLGPLVNRLVGGAQRMITPLSLHKLW